MTFEMEKYPGCIIKWGGDKKTGKRSIPKSVQSSPSLAFLLVCSDIPTNTHSSAASMEHLPPNSLFSPFLPIQFGFQDPLFQLFSCILHSLVPCPFAFPYHFFIMVKYTKHKTHHITNF